MHLLAAAATGDAWVVDSLRQAAGDALTRGAPDVAIQCLERALAEPPAAGAAATCCSSWAAPRPFTRRPPRPSTWPRRWPEARAGLAGARSRSRSARRSDCAAASPKPPNCCRRPSRPRATIALRSAFRCRPRCSTSHAGTSIPDRSCGRYLSGCRPAPTAVRNSIPQLHANLAIELGAAGLDRERAIHHAREAVRATPRLMSLTSTALPEAVTVLLFAGLSDEARQGADTWLRLAQQRGWPMASALAATVASLTALYDGEVGAGAGVRAAGDDRRQLDFADGHRLHDSRPDRQGRNRRGAHLARRG